jgi:hypothetical protein
MAKAQKGLDYCVTAAALAPGLNLDTLSKLTFFTLEAYLLASAQRALALRSKVVSCPKVSFARVPTGLELNSLDARLDLYSLQKMSGPSFPGKRKVIKVQPRDK